MTSSASRQLMNSMKPDATSTLVMPQVTSSNPHVTRSAMRSVSDVTRDMIQPTAVLSK